MAHGRSKRKISGFDSPRSGPPGSRLRTPMMELNLRSVCVRPESGRDSEGATLFWQQSFARSSIKFSPRAQRKPRERSAAPDGVDGRASDAQKSLSPFVKKCDPML